MPRKIKPFIVFCALLLTMCRFYAQDERVTPIDRLSCQTYTDYFEQGLGVSKGLECFYTCPDETVTGPLDFETDPSLSLSEGDLDRMYCGIAPQFTPTEPAASMSPTPAASPTLAAIPTIQASSTAEISPTSESPLLTGQVTMCDTGASLISFRIAQPPPDLTGQTLTAQIADLDSICAVNPTNPALLTCTIPPAVTFPATVVVSLDGAVVSDFIYDGLGCEQLTTPMPTTTP
jgi:hypothetical protein